MPAPLDTPFQIKLPATITIAGLHHQQIIHVQFNTRNINIMGRAYASVLKNSLTKIMNPLIPIPQLHPTKGIANRRSENMT
jgi:ATP-dependent phosphoenolpyruvate carboxykinase